MTSFFASVLSKTFKSTSFITAMTQEQKQSSSRRWILVVLALAFVGGLAFGWKYIQAVFMPAVPDTLVSQYVQIPTGSSFEEVVSILKKGGFIRDEAAFRWLAGEMNYKKEKMRAGRFEIKPGWTTRQLIQHLRNGEQAPVTVVLNSERLPEDVAGTVSRFIEADSLSLIKAFRDPAQLAATGYTTETLIAAFIPNSYEMFWNTDAKGFLDRMLKENKAFWDKNDRRAKAKALSLTETQAYTLASIVERETNHNPEKPTIAGVYLNRLKINMRLQADPTSVFATRDFSTRRVTEYHTTYDSPYNTYVYKGLPPGPISMASIPSLDAVLNPERHNYIYFCAKPDDSGTHAFAVTFEAHKVNAERFQQWVTTQRK